MRNIILGTAGHIDHGKTSLVKALTGIDADRLKEEKERGITIDIGFASYGLPDGTRLGIVDVPGHERLIKNMLAGVGGIDMVMLVIAANEGIMPQTREHLMICNLLKIKKGLVAVTKTDIVEEEWLELVIDDIKEYIRGTFLEGCPVVPVSSVTKENLNDLIGELAKIAGEIEEKSSEGLFRLPVDRVFTMKGLGTVLTGTLLSGKVSQNDEVEIFCGRISARNGEGIRTRLRGIQCHNKHVSIAVAGQRTALNLQGVEKNSITRGDVVSIPDAIRPSYMIDGQFLLLKEASKPLKNRARIRFYTGTKEVMGRIILLDREKLEPGDNTYVQFRLEEPVFALAGDRYIVRFYSPVETIGGGTILDNNPLKYRKKKAGAVIKNLEILEKGSLTEKLSLQILKQGVRGEDINGLLSWIDDIPARIEEAIEQSLKNKEIVLIDKGKSHYVHKNIFDRLKKGVLSELNNFHKKNPLKFGISKEEIRKKMGDDLPQRLVEAVLKGLEKGNDIAIEKNTVRLASFEVRLGRDQEDIKERILRFYKNGGVQPPLMEEICKDLGIDLRQMGDIISILVKEEKLVRIDSSLCFYQEIFDKIKEMTIKYLTKNKKMTVADMRDMIKTTRKYAVPLCEYFDSINLTMRIGDERVLREK